MSRRVVIYHGNCMDGFTAAWVARQKFRDSAEYVAVHHGDPVPDVAGADVLIVDFSPSGLVGSLDAAKSVTVYDHHVSERAALEGRPGVVFDVNRSGAGITWDELNPGVPRPWLVDYVEDRDLWRFSLPASKAINAWISCVSRTFTEWNLLLAFGTALAEQNGRAVLQHISQYVDDVAKNARVILFCGYTVPCVNAAYPMISELVGKLAEGHPFAIGWSQGGDGRIRVSLRSRGDGGADVSVIAKRFGGGGHKNAAGFELNLLDLIALLGGSLA